MKYKLFIIVITVQLVVVIVLLSQIFVKTNNYLGTSIHVISSKTIQKAPSNRFKYFYEPKSNTIEKVNEWGPYKGMYTINSDSLNERYNYSEKKDKGVYRIITIGDSFTYGLYVDTVNNWTEILEDNLNLLNCQKIEVINLGVYGHDIAYQVERFRIRGVKYNPDLVIWFIVDPNRITEFINEAMEKNKNKLEKQIININSYEPWIIARQEILRDYGLDKIYKYQLESLFKINDYYGGKLLLIIQKQNIKQSFLFLDEFAKRRNNTTIHMTVDIQNNPDLHFKTDSHPNKEGHKTIAEDVFQYLTKNKLIPCQP